jgi:hypothetical protein
MSDEFWTKEELNLRLERLVVSFESIAKSLEGLNEESKKAGTRYWPKPGKAREIIVGGIPTEEDRIKERQGYGVPISEWLTNVPNDDDDEDDDEYIGERQREWRRTHPYEGKEVKVIDASPEVVSVGEQDRASVETVESETGSNAVDSSYNKNVKERPKRRTKNRS